MNEHEWAEVIGVIGMFVLLICVVTMTIWQVAKSLRAKAVLAREDSYKKLAEAAVSSQQATELQLAELGTQLTEMRDRMGTLERILKEVE
ncbi:hypothetical protein LHJ74_06375 [Streptomyces sp. N2-109]|uniref:Secreted protein n=1 Tax=Streptomyces gossypii TaxID=2883101 RepID=A0ABT2JNU3_9ACTN|nr:hypothetical protein [Streptomyces gossypii]MCT2589552.1 hypothetical protein [Streptomyces gossypii]